MLYLSGMRPGYRNFYSALVVMSLLALAACQQSGPDDRALIQQRLQQMVQAVEKRQAAAFLEAIRQDFSGQGTMRKAGLAGLLLLQFRQHAAISVRLFDVRIQLDGPVRATVEMTATLHGESGLLGPGRDLRIQSRWQKVDADWQVDRARWQWRD